MQIMASLPSLHWNVHSRYAFCFFALSPIAFMHKLLQIIHINERLNTYVRLRLLICPLISALISALNYARSMFLPGPLAPPFRKRPSLKMTERSYSWTTWNKKEKKLFKKIFWEHSITKSVCCLGEDCEGDQKRWLNQTCKQDRIKKTENLSNLTEWEDCKHVIFLN